MRAPAPEASRSKAISSELAVDAIIERMAEKISAALAKSDGEAARPAASVGRAPVALGMFSMPRPWRAWGR
jgi:hypothetical protein